jgi:hypothetical protein
MIGVPDKCEGYWVDDPSFGNTGTLPRKMARSEYLTDQGKIASENVRRLPYGYAIHFEPHEYQWTPELPGFPVQSPVNHVYYVYSLGSFGSEQTCNIAAVYASLPDSEFRYSTANDSWGMSLQPEVQVIKAPKWLRDQRRVSRHRPPPTLQKVQMQFKASAEIRRKLDANLNY